MLREHREQRVAHEAGERLAVGVGDILVQPPQELQQEVLLLGALPVRLLGLRLVPTDGVPSERAGWAPLDLMERMAAEAAHRLSLGLPALLRSARDDMASWILLEPDGDRVRLAVLRDMESPWATWFPVAMPPRWTNPADAPARLYAYVEEQRARLLRSFDRPAAEHAHLRGRSIARGALTAALASAAATAGRACRVE